MQGTIYLATENDIKRIVTDVIGELQSQIGKQPKEEERLYTEKETAELLRCHEMTLLKWRKKGYIPFIKIAGSIRYRESDINQLLKDGVNQQR